VTATGPGSDTILETTAGRATVAAPATDPDGGTGSPAEASPPGGTILSRTASVTLGVVAACAAAYALLLRAWMLVHLPLFGDEAVVGLMARSIGAGHFSAFYWGQRYGGLESSLAALGLKVGGGGETALNATPAVLLAVAALLVAGIVAAAGRDRLTAIAAGTAVWVWPFVAVWQSVRELGFREAALCCGLAAVFCSIRAGQGRAGSWTFGLLGLAIGLGWWASPEIVYFVIPCLVLLWGWWRAATVDPGPDSGRSDASPGRVWSLAVLVGAVVVGSLPWWYANVHSRFASLRQSGLPANGGASYGTKFSVFFHDMLPLQLGLRTVVSGAWLGGTAFGVTVYVVLLVVIAAAVVRAVAAYAADSRQRVPMAIGLAVVAYPFLYAAAPGTSYWVDGRYGIYLPALIVALLATLPRQPLVPRLRARQARHARGVASDRPGAVRPSGARPLRRGHVVAAVGLAGALALTVAGAHNFGVPAPARALSDWHSGDAPMQEVVNGLRAHHIHDAYGDYWTAYDLDFLSGGQPTVSPSPYDVTRSAAIADAVGRAPDPAWLFFAPSQTEAAATTFGNPQPGPGPFTEQTFEEHLATLGIGYHVVHLGLLDAVVPERKVPT
jgi:hypothetical protein